KPGYPEAIVSGFNQYEELYADAKLWLNEGWIDYFSPQLYWPIVRVGQSFPVLLGWWASENTKKRHLWPGISVGRDTARAVVNETIGQIMISRGMLPESPGVIHWSISSDTKNPALQKSLLEGPYKKPALIPASPWLDNEAPEAPALAYSEQGDKIKIQWTHTHPNDVFKWVVYYRYGNTWDYQILNAPVRTLELKTTEENKTINAIAVSAVDRTGNESKKTTAFPDSVKIVPRKEWNAADPRPLKQHTPVRITVHHEGGRVLRVADDAGHRLKAIQTWRMGPEDRPSYAIAVSAVDRTGNDSKKTTAFPDIVKIVPRKEWNAADPRPFKQHTPVRITVHHEGGRVLKVTDDAGQRLKAIQTWSMGP